MEKLSDYEVAKARFQLHTSTSDLERDTLIKGWELYHKTETASGNPTLLVPVVRGLHTASVLKALRGESFDSTTASLGHFGFQLETYKPVGQEVGVLLAGLHQPELARAITFCDNMNFVGWSKADLDEKYPLEVPSILRGWRDLPEPNAIELFYQTSETFQNWLFGELNRTEASFAWIISTLEEGKRV